MNLGYTRIEPYIDLIAIWKCYPNINRCIEKFCEVDTHETLHKVIIEILGEQHELAIDKLTEKTI